MNPSSNSLDFEQHVFRKLGNRDNTLDDAELETWCPLDNGRHDFMPTPTCLAASQLDSLPLELLVEVLLHLDIPSLTRFRSVNRRAMDIVDSIHQYSAIIKHCPDIIRAIVSIQADAFDLRTLYRTLSTSRCNTCNNFGYYLYLINCHRVCYLCFTLREEFFPLTTHEASKFFKPNANSPKNIKSSRKLLELANPPSILSLPGRYCDGLPQNYWEGKFRGKRLRLYDRRAVDPNFVCSIGLPDPESEQTTTGEPKRFMAIISSPVLINAGREVDEGFFCRGCRDESWPGGENKHFRIKYTVENMPEHILRYGPVGRDPRNPERFMHITNDRRD